VWCQNIYVVIIPSLLAIAYLGQSIYLYLINLLKLSSVPLATWLAQFGSIAYIKGQIQIAPWEFSLTATAVALSMTVNVLVTGLIVFKIRKMFSAVANNEAHPMARTMSSTGDTKFRHIIFVIIESGMALLVIQVGRFVLTLMPRTVAVNHIINFVIVTQRMFNVIIRSVHFFTFALLITKFTWLGHRTDNNFGAGFNEFVLP
jgi:hypothetical protein